MGVRGSLFLVILSVSGSTLSGEEDVGIPSFSAVCEDSVVKAYRYALGLDGEIVADEWSQDEEFFDEWKIIYSGSDFVTLDGEKCPVIARHDKGILFSKANEGLFGAGVWVYAVNIDVKKLVAAQVHSGEGFGGSIKTRSVEFECEFVIHD